MKSGICAASRRSRHWSGATAKQTKLEVALRWGVQSKCKKKSTSSAKNEILRFYLSMTAQPRLSKERADECFKRASWTGSIDMAGLYPAQYAAQRRIETVGRGRRYSRRN